MKNTYLIGCAALAISIAACGGGSTVTPPSGGGGGSPPPSSMPSVQPSATPTVTPSPAAPMTIGFALPTGAIGTVNTQFGLLGGYTQQTRSQVVAFPPGTTVTLRNLSSNTPHTLNVLSMSSFPSNPNLSFNPSGGNTLGAGFASGAIQGGGTMQIKLSNPGTYFVGCAFHYPLTPSMRGVIEVSSSATPGPQATPPPSGGGGGGGGGGY